MEQGDMGGKRSQGSVGVGSTSLFVSHTKNSPKPSGVLQHISGWECKKRIGGERRFHPDYYMYIFYLLYLRQFRSSLRVCVCRWLVTKFAKAENCNDRQWLTPIHSVISS